MDFIMKKITVTTVLMVFFLLFSGCVTDKIRNTSSITTIQPSPVSISHPPSPARYSIRIDPIRDFPTDSTFTINGSSLLTISGTTDFPEGTGLHFDIFSIDQSHFVCQTIVRITGNASGPNLFSYAYDMKGNPTGQYRVILRDDSWVSTAISEFKIASELPYLAWIKIDPVERVTIGKDLPISGTTNMPAGSQIKIKSMIYFHTCYPGRVPDANGIRSLCGGSCSTAISEQIVPVRAGPGNTSIWNASIRTTDWCANEGYQIDATAVNRTNVTPGFVIISA